MSAVAYRNTQAGARQFVPDEGIDLQKRYRRERLIEQARRWNKAHGAPPPPPPPAPVVKETDEERALAILRKNCAPGWVIKIVLKVASARGVSPLEIAGRSKSPLVVSARNEVLYRVRKRNPVRHSWRTIAGWFGREHKSIVFSVSSHALETGKPPLTTTDVVAYRNHVREWQRAHRAKPDASRASPSSM